MSFTTASSGRVMWTRSAPGTASFGEAATLAPADSSARALASVRFHTVTESPRFSIPSTIALPSSPVPINATFAIATLPLQSIAVRRFSHLLIVVTVASASLWERRSTQNPQNERFSAISARSVVAVVAAQAPQALRWAGDPEGGAPFVEANPARPDEVVGFDVDVAALLARGLGRVPSF